MFLNGCLLSYELYGIFDRAQNALCYELYGIFDRVQSFVLANINLKLSHLINIYPGFTKSSWMMQCMAANKNLLTKLD